MAVLAPAAGGAEGGFVIFRLEVVAGYDGDDDWFVYLLSPVALVSLNNFCKLSKKINLFG
jgi:hypothetical protein